VIGDHRSEVGGRRIASYLVSRYLLRAPSFNVAGLALL